MSQAVEARSPAWGLIGVLGLLGAAWGMGQPLTKIAVSTGHGPWGLIFWQFLTGALVLALIQLVRRRPVPLARGDVQVYAVIALLGTLLPMAASFIAYRHLPAGIMSILISMVPMLAFPIALALGADRFSWVRLGGLSLGLAGVALLILPQGGLAMPNALGWVLLGMVAPTFYAIEANYVGHCGVRGMGAMQVLHGASWVGAGMSLPVALATGQMFIPGGDPRADGALIAASVLHVFAYSGYVWLVGRAGSTFAAQCAYLVTGFGVLWAMLLLGERYSGWAWGAMALVLCGLALVQPRPKLAPGAAANLGPGDQ
ncbi:DMT family transporter [Frigidibacter sp. ROC022]|uniref:DMT family transporter n=1 Tax=Frigidibacter sp. ROC022 TaxID=2971796 RepID=UPI00215A1535|nr:DMT family transporter [Frigidibacter sp. ROC022]MCR8722954.1 DMT family transporter [Frigidibacter sp. ROC022]